MARLAWAAGFGGLIVGFAAAELGPALSSADPPMAVAAIQAELPEVLESEVSGTTVAFNDPVQGISGTVKPLSTFLNADGSYCRAYEASASHEDGTLTSRGVACRDEAGHWLTRVQVNTAGLDRASLDIRWRLSADLGRPSSLRAKTPAVPDRHGSAQPHCS